MRRLLTILAAMAVTPAAAQDGLVVTEQVTQRAISQSGGNLAETEQAGRGNSAETVQRGSGNRAVIRQSGTGNLTSIVQQGIGNSAESLQAGNRLGVAVTQTGVTGSIRINQFSPGADGATILQTGPGSVKIR